MKIMVLGAGGQVGQQLARYLDVHQTVFLDRSQVNLEIPGQIAAAVRTLQPDIIINAAAYTAVDRAESERQRAMQVNAHALQELVASADINSWIVHYSTDYVFDGCLDGWYRPEDATGPLNVYGESKLLGERILLEGHARTIILRTSWVYSVSGANFPRTILRLAREKDELRIVDDQIGAPTSAALIAKTTAHIVRHLAGCLPIAEQVYHLVAGGSTSWFGFAGHLLGLARAGGYAVPPVTLVPVTSDDYGFIAKRPHNSRLDTSGLEQVFGVNLPDWRDALDQHLKVWMNTK